MRSVLPLPCAAIPAAVLAVLMGCPGGGPSRTDGGASDAGATSGADGGPSGRPDGGAADAGQAIDPETLTPGDVVSVRIDGGAPTVVEVVAEYDHAAFWGAPEARVSLALYSDADLHEYPYDRSIHIVDRAALSAVQRQAVAPTYVDALRDEEIVFLRPPLDDEQVVLTGHDTYHLEEDGYGQFAWDIVTHDDDGRRFVGDGTLNTDYVVYGRPVFLPRGGTLIDAIDDLPDNPPGFLPEAENYLDIGNNLIGVHLYGNYYMYLLHLIPGSIPDTLAPGMLLDTGTYVGTVGNSGVSLEPHLHVVVYYYDPIAERSWAVPSEWNDILLDDEPRTYAVPEKDQRLRAAD